MHYISQDVGIVAVHTSFISSVCRKDEMRISSARPSLIEVKMNASSCFQFVRWSLCT